MGAGPGWRSSSGGAGRRRCTVVRCRAGSRRGSRPASAAPSCRTSARPMPLPSMLLFSRPRRLKGSKRRASCARSMPMPLSTTRNCRWPGTASSSTRTCPPRRPYLIALPSRFSRIWRRRSGSASAWRGGPAKAAEASRTPALSACTGPSAAPRPAATPRPPDGPAASSRRPRCRGHRACRPAGPADARRPASGADPAARHLGQRQRRMDLQQLGVAEDRMQRRPQFVAGLGQQAGPGPGWPPAPLPSARPGSRPVPAPAPRWRGDSRCW